MPTASRRPHFRRHAPPPLRITDDDIAIVRHVGKHRFLRSTHIARLLQRPAKKVVERLGALYHTGYLDRPRAQLDYYATSGRAPYVYALGNRGAALLAEVDGVEQPKVDWTDKNREAGRLFLEHTLLTADVMVAFEVALFARPDIRLIAPEQIVANAPEATRRSRNPFKFTVTVAQNGYAGRLSVIPDKVFGLDYTTERKRSYFFLEADRATMPIMRSTLAQTSMYRKFVTYSAGGGTDNLFGKQLGIGNFRVLTVTSGSTRSANMISVLRLAARPSGQFLFAAHKELISESDLLAFDWTSGRNSAVQIGS